jgi:hypothetical protein
LYNDTGDGYGYEKGEYRLTRVKWDDTARNLTYETVHADETVLPYKLLTEVV